MKHHPVRFELDTTERSITVAAGYTPAVNIHEPDSTYCRHYWLAELGPSSYLAWTYLLGWLPDSDTAAITIDYPELAYSLGTAPGRLTKALQRLAAFHLAHTLPGEPTTLYLKRRAPTFNERQLARLAERCPTLAACHDEQRRTA